MQIDRRPKILSNLGHCQTQIENNGSRLCVSNKPNNIVYVVKRLIFFVKWK